MFKDKINILLLVIVLGAVASSTGLFRMKEMGKVKRISTEERLWQEKIAKKKTEKELSSLENDADFIQDTLGERKKEARSLESELAEYKQQARLAQQKITDLNSKVIFTEGQIRQANAAIAELKTKVANIITDTTKLVEELSLLQETKDALKEHLRQQLKKSRRRESREAAYITEPEQAQPVALQPSLVGEILIVNREFDFVVVNLGREDGVKEGMILDICREDDILSHAEIETVRANVSAAALVDKDRISQLRAGDKALLYSEAGPSALREEDIQAVR